MGVRQKKYNTGMKTNIPLLPNNYCVYTISRSRGTAKSTREYEVIMATSLYSKVQSPPYCCTVHVYHCAPPLSFNPRSKILTFHNFCCNLHTYICVTLLKLLDNIFFKTNNTYISVKQNTV